MNESVVITAEALIVAALLAWAGSWRDTYKEYSLHEHPIWHVNLSLAAIYVGVLSSLLSLIFSVISIREPLKGVPYNLSIGFAGYSMTILFITTFLTAFTIFIKAMRGDTEWKPLWITQHRAKLVTLIVLAFGVILLSIWLLFLSPRIGPLLAPASGLAPISISPSATSPLTILTQQQTSTNSPVTFISPWVSAIKDFITAIAIIVGAVWSYNKFVKNRQNYPRSKITHNVSSLPLLNDKTLIHVNVKIENTGNILLCIMAAEIRILQLLPLPGDLEQTIHSGKDPVPEDSRDIKWPELAFRNFLSKEGLEIEPGESDWLSYDFVIDKRIKFIRIYTYVKNVSKKTREIGWPIESFYDLQDSELNMY